jgi:hypothetical protein
MTHLCLDLSSSPLPFYLPPLSPYTSQPLDFLSPLAVTQTFLDPPRCLTRRRGRGGVEIGLTLHAPHLNFAEHTHTTRARSVHLHGKRRHDIV